MKDTNMDNFDLKKYLVENKVTTNSRMLVEKLDPFTFSNDVQAVINQLIKMGPKGKQTLAALEATSTWNELVQVAVDETSADSFKISNDLLAVTNELIDAGKQDVLDVLNSLEPWQDLMDTASMT